MDLVRKGYSFFLLDNGLHQEVLERHPSAARCYPCRRYLLTCGAFRVVQKRPAAQG